MARVRCPADLSTAHSRSSAERSLAICHARQDAASSSLRPQMGQLPSATGATPVSQNDDEMRIPARISLAVALAHWTGRTEQVEVPQTFAQLHSVFWLHPTPIAALIFILCLVFMRSGQGTVYVADCAACSLGVAIWIVQEWAIHKKLFHGDIEWFGKTTHMEHHQAPYYHISIDDPIIAFGVMVLSTVVFGCALGVALGSVANLGYIMAGLCYQFTHYSVHCRFVPSNKLARTIRAHHMQHHCRNENYWLSFTLPQVDTWMNTNPIPSSVPMTELAKAAVRNRK